MNDLFNCETQLDRIEAKLDQLLAKKKTTRKPKQVEYTPEFEVAWKHYPKRAGSNPKNKAFAAWNARIAKWSFPDNIENEVASMQTGVAKYATFCDATGKTGTELVMQASRFFGPNHEYRIEWTIPVDPKVNAIPKDDNGFMSWCAEKGYRSARPGESMFEYRRAIESQHREQGA